MNWNGLELPDIKPYYSDDAVIIYNLQSVPMCDKLYIDYCTEVDSCQKKVQQDTERGNVAKTSPNYRLVQRRDTNNLQNISKKELNTAMLTLIGKATMSLLSLLDVGLNVVILKNLVSYVEITRQRGIIKTATRKIINLVISNFCAVNAICVRTVG